jgi:hypothetical protein
MNPPKSRSHVDEIVKNNPEVPWDLIKRGFYGRARQARNVKKAMLLIGFAEEEIEDLDWACDFLIHPFNPYDYINRDFMTEVFGDNY